MKVLKEKKIVLVSTVPYFMVAQLSSQIQYFASLGMSITLITSPGQEALQLPKGNNIKIVLIDIPRKIEIWKDVRALLKLYNIFKQEEFHILHSFTPKAGLLCAVAGKFAKVALRFHTFTGQAWVTREGMMRSVMRMSDKLIIRLMVHCYADSPSQRNFLISEGIAKKNAISVIGHGSLGGVDSARFSPTHLSITEKDKQKEILGISGASCVYIYAGRITMDKGIRELLDAFEKVRSINPASYLLLVGPVDNDGKAVFRQALKSNNICCLGYQSKVEHFFAVSDVLCLPSYREGFGTVVVEAGAMQVPCIGTNIPGLIDAVDDGVTGLLVPVRNSEHLSAAMISLANNKDLCKAMGKAARCRVLDRFDTKVINSEWVKEYIRWMVK